MYVVSHGIEAKLFGEEIKLTDVELTRRMINAQPIGEMTSKLSGLSYVTFGERFSERRDLDENWQDGANCLGVDPDLFFPERGADTSEAKEVCRGCVVRDDCLEFALQNREKFGIWGGMSERERRRIRSSRSAAARTTLAKTNDRP